MSVSVIMATGNKRPKALRNTLTSWMHVNYPIDFILVDTDNSVEVENVAKEFSFISKLSHVPDDDHSRDWARVTRAWTREGKACQGDYVIFAMADEIVGDYDIVQGFISSPTPYRTSILNYFLSPDETRILDTMDWVSDPKVLEGYSDFWTHMAVEGADNVGNLYRKNHPEIAVSQTHITGAPREHWEYMNWFRTDEHGYWWLDMDLFFRETAVNRHCIPLANHVCYHQWHPLLLLSDEDRDFGGYIYENEKQARLLEEAKRIS